MRVRFVVIAYLLAALAGCREPAGRTPGAAPENLSIYYTCDVRGNIEPCGCASAQAGGIARRMTVIRQHNVEHALLVDAGDLTAGPRDWEVFELTYVLKGYKAMGYHAVNAGHREASLGADTLRRLNSEYELFVSANLLDESGHTVLPAFRVVDLQRGYRIGILGVTDDSLSQDDLGPGLRVIPPADAVTKHLPTLKAEVDCVLLLAFADMAVMKALAEQFFEIDVIVGGRVPQPTHEPMSVNRSTIVANTNLGKTLGRLDVVFGNPEPPRYTNSVFMLEDIIPDDPAIAEVVNEFKMALGEQDFRPHRDDVEGLTLITAAGSQGANKYVLSESCQECHPEAYAIWTESRHAHAFESLVKRGHQYNPRCLKCHTEGHMQPDGYVNQKLTPEYAKVACDNCHGRGDLHNRFFAKEPGITEQAAKLKKVDCFVCHDEENSPEFNAEGYWEKIKHDEK
jgi:hypothetical protein